MTWNALRITVLCACCGLYGATTTIQGTYSTIEGKPASGTIVIEVTRSFTASDGTYVPAQKKTYQIKDGKLSVALQPNTGSTPASFYTATTAIANGPAESTIWIVPVSATPLTIGAVVSSSPPAASHLVSPQQINPVGATAGQVLTLIGGAYAPAALPPSGVSSVNSQTGAVTITAAGLGAELAANKNIANGYAPLDAGTKLPTANLPTGIDAANVANGSVSNTEYQHLDGVTSAIQTQFAGKIHKDASAIWVSDSCPTGPYDSTCISTAFTSASNNSVLIFDRMFTVATKVTVSGKNYLTIKGVGGGGITSDTNLNDYQIEFNNCYYCRISDMIFNGNGANQSAASRGVRFLNSSAFALDGNSFFAFRNEPVWYEHASAVGAQVAGKIYNNQFKDNLGSILYGEVNGAFQYGYMYFGHNQMVVTTSEANLLNASAVTLKGSNFYWDSNACRVDSRGSMFGGAMFRALTLDTTSAFGFALYTENCSGFPASFMTGINGATTLNVATNLTPPTWSWNIQHTPAANCGGGAAGTLNVTVSPTSTPTVQCLGTDPHAYGGVRLVGTSQYIVFRALIPKTSLLFATAPIEVKVGYYTATSGGTVGMRADIACLSANGTNSATQTYTNGSDNLQGVAGGAGKQFEQTFNLTAANLATYGCASHSSVDSILFLRFRKSTGTSAVDFVVTDIDVKYKRLLQ